MKRKLNARDEPEVERPDSTSVAPTANSDQAVQNTFAALGLDTRLLQAVTQQKFSKPTPVQTRAIPLALLGKDVLALARTGSGKTLAYLLPVLNAILVRKNQDKRAKSTTVLILVPTKELANQVTGVIDTLTKTSTHLIRAEDIMRKEDAAVTKARLLSLPDIVIATPARAMQFVNDESLKLDTLKHLIIDEADVVLNFGHQEDLASIATALPSGVQKLMMSATLRTEIDELSALFFGTEESTRPTILDLSAEEAEEQSKLSQYVLRTAEDEKFLLIYAIFKLQLIKGKIIVFVADIDRCYRLKLFLEQFGVRSCVLNSELPVNSRLHVVEEFNRGVYNIIIAADETEVMGNEEGRRRRKQVEEAEAADSDEGEQEAPEEGNESSKTKGNATKGRPPRRRREDREFGVSRGIDFKNVTCVLNFDLPTSSKSYTHRIGRTARAGQDGMALSLYVPSELYRKHKPTSIPQCEHDEAVLGKIKASQSKKGNEVKEWGLDWEKLAAFRYRLADALRSVTRIAVREARTTELRNELIKSEKLKRHFEENPEDLRHLRHDTETHAVRQQPHLRHVPDYLLPAGGKAAVSKDVGFVGIRKDMGSENRIRKARAFNKSRGKGRLAERKRRGGGDPLKTFNAMGRKKK